MNVLIKTVGGGIFSKFMVGVQSLIDTNIDIKDIDSIYINVDYGRLDRNTQPRVIENETKNPFDFVLDQELLVPHVVIPAIPRQSYTDHDILTTKMVEQFNRFRLICDKIKIKNSVLDRVNKNIDENTIGVHVRLTDMAAYHPEHHNQHTTQNYIDKIDSILTSNNKLFIASDNVESLNTLKKYYGDIVLTNEVGNRHHMEGGGKDYGLYMAREMHTKSFWEDSFLDMISLSKCSTLIYKPSNLNNTSMGFSKTINKTYKI